MAVDNLPTFDTYAVEDNSKRGSQMQPFVYLLAMVGATVDASPTAAAVPDVSKPPASGPNQAPSPKNSPATWVGYLDYPTKSLQREEGGKVSFKLSVSKWGTLADCTVVKSSGSKDLDEQTCQKLMERASFRPATDGNGQTVAGEYFGNVRWYIPDDAEAPRLASLFDPQSGTISVSAMRVYPSVSADGSEARSKPVPIANPGSWISPADYPPAALAKKYQGTTQFTVQVGRDGRVVGCTIRESSGSADLDAATCANVTRRARFSPALDSSGDPVEGTYTNSVRWQIPKETLPVPGTTTLLFVVEKDGSLVKCEFREAGILKPRGGPCATTPSFDPPLDEKGNPVRKQFVVSVVTRVTEMPDPAKDDGAPVF